MRATVYLVTAEGVPFGRTVLELLAVDTETEFRMRIRARFAEQLKSGGRVEFGPVGAPWHTS